MTERDTNEQCPGDSTFEALVCDLSVFRREDLKAFAGARCLDIFNDFAESEIGRQPASVRGAWKVGRVLANFR